MAKFFYNKVHNTKKTILKICIISMCIISIIVLFFVVTKFTGEDLSSNSKNVNLKKTVTIEVNEKYDKEIFFSKIENYDINDIDINYPEDYDPSKTGTYDIEIVIDNKNYSIELVIVDTKQPTLKLKELSIKKGEIYSAKDFVESCNDNSNKECNIDFYSNGTDEDANPIDYSKYTEEGTYPIKILATDETGNQTIGETKLTIGNNSTITTTPVDCKYGDTNYDKDEYLVAVFVATNGCAISLDLYQNTNTISDAKKLLESETTRIKKDVEALGKEGTPTLNRKITAVTNKTGNGIVGYEIKITITLTKNNKSSTIAEYKLDENGKRIFSTNTYNLDN